MNQLENTPENKNKKISHMKKKYAVRPDKDYEAEPDYGITLTCIECGEKDTVSGQFAEAHGIDNTNFVCHNCQYLCD